MENISEQDKALVMSLVHDHIKQNPVEYSSWVGPHYSVRKAGKLRVQRRRATLTLSHIGGHWRMKAMYRRLLRALKCVCKWQDHGAGRQEAKPLAPLDDPRMLTIAMIANEHGVGWVEI